MTLQSMTGFASLAGTADGVTWTWEVRSVNGRGLDLRMRLPEGFDGLEAAIRTELQAAFSRGSITVALKLGRDASPSMPTLNLAAFEAAMHAAEAATALAAQRGLVLAPPSLADLLSVRGVMEVDGAVPGENSTVLEGLIAQVPSLVAALREVRAAEGGGLARMIGERAGRIEELTAVARQTDEGRAAQRGTLLRERLEAVLAATAAVDEARLAQELALIAVRADVTEELDRLGAHLDAVRTTLASKGPVGRRLDFLTQELNREANTLCSKSGSPDLTAVGVEMKVAIDQMREQIQNVE